MPGTNFAEPSAFLGRVLVSLTDDNGRIMLGSFTGSVPSNANQFTKGCILAKTDAATGVSSLYENTGTVASPSFDLIGDISPGEIALTDTEILVGNGSNVAAGVALSGDATIANTGAMTIANDAVTEPKVADSAGVGGLFIKKTALAVYDFSVDGGTEGVITLGSTATIPDNSVITAITYDVITTCVSSSDAATIAFSVPTNGAFTTAIAISDASDPFDAGVHLDSVAVPIAIKTTAARAIQITTAGGQDLTAGKFIIAVDYYVSE